MREEENFFLLIFLILCLLYISIILQVYCVYIYIDKNCIGILHSHFFTSVILLWLYRETFSMFLAFCVAFYFVLCFDIHLSLYPRFKFVCGVNLSPFQNWQYHEIETCCLWLFFLYSLFLSLMEWLRLQHLRRRKMFSFNRKE